MADVCLEGESRDFHQTETHSVNFEIPGNEEIYIWMRDRCSRASIWPWFEWIASQSKSPSSVISHHTECIKWPLCAARSIVRLQSIPFRAFIFFFAPIFHHWNWPEPKPQMQSRKFVDSRMLESQNENGFQLRNLWSGISMWITLKAYYLVWMLKNYLWLALS